MDEELRAIEKQLEQLSPAEMPDDFLARMEQAMDNWQEHLPAEEKIVQFEPVAREKKSLFNVWATAAAVALMAATSFLVFNGEESADPQLAEASVVPEPLVELAPQSPPSKTLSGVVPASNTQFNTQVKSASNDVITYDAKGRPMRVMQVEFEDEVTVRGRDGRLYKIKQPRREYYAVPVEIH